MADSSLQNLRNEELVRRAQAAVFPRTRRRYEYEMWRRGQEVLELTAQGQLHSAEAQLNTAKATLMHGDVTISVGALRSAAEETLRELQRIRESRTVARTALLTVGIAFFTIGLNVMTTPVPGLPAIEVYARLGTGLAGVVAGVILLWLSTHRSKSERRDAARYEKNIDEYIAAQKRLASASIPGTEPDQRPQ